MDEIVPRRDYRAIVRALTVIRLQQWLLQRAVVAGRHDDATLIERLRAIEEQSKAIADILNTIDRVAPVRNDPE